MSWLKLCRSPVIVLAAAMLLAGPANALSVSYFLDQTNTDAISDPAGNLPDGQDYLEVTFADSMSVPGDIDVTLTLLSPLTSIADANFGIQSFHFNDINNALTAADIIGLPAGWTASVDLNPANPNLNADGFGAYEVRVRGSGMNRQAPTLTFTISVAGDSIFDYAEALSGGAQGAYFFAAHVAGFVDQNPLAPADDPFDGMGLCYDTDGQGNFTPECNFLTSAWFGGSAGGLVPEPSTLGLTCMGLAGLLLMGRRRR